MKLLYRAILSLILLASIADFAHADLSISPLKHEFTIEAGWEKSETIKVTNGTNTALTLYTTKEDFIAGGDSGTPSFVKPQDRSSDAYGLSDWITVEDKNLTLAKGESREIKFKVKVPKTGEPGGHYGAIFFSPAVPSGSQVSVVQRLGVLVLVNVPGNVKVEGKLTSFDVGSLGIKKDFAPQTAFSQFPIVFETKFKNEGNVHLKPTGKVELIDEDGKVLKNVGKETLSTPQGLYLGEQMVDYIPVNSGLGSVLPKSERRFEYNWEGFGYTVLNSDGTKSVKFKNLTEYYADQATEKRRFLAFYESVHTRSVTKKITANLSIAYNAPNKDHKDFRDSKTFEVSYEEDYVGINYAVVGGVIGLIVLIALYILVYLPRSRERLRQELLEEMSKSSR